VTPEERQLLECTVRSVLKLKEDILDRVTGVEAVVPSIRGYFGAHSLRRTKATLVIDGQAISRLSSFCRAYLDRKHS
jgi:hypothetical protein